MADYSKYLDGLMAYCKRSVQRSCDQHQSPHFFRSCAQPYSSKITVSPPCSSEDHSVTALAANARSSVNENMPLAANAPQFATSASACPKPKVIEPTSPLGHAAQTSKTDKDRVQIKLGEDFLSRYRDLPNRQLRQELKRRGLCCSGGANVELARRLEKDDNFQSEARTAEDYDAMNLQDIYTLCTCRSIPSNGTELVLRDRLKAHDKRKYGTAASNPGLQPSLLPREACIKEKSGLMTNDPEQSIENTESNTNKLAGTRVTRSLVSTAKAPASHTESREPVQTGQSEKDVERTNKLGASQSEPKRLAQTGRREVEVRREDNLPISRRTQLRYRPKDELALLQICVKLKTVIGWGEINGFWSMVQDTLQLKTGKEYKKVSRHVRILVEKRRVELADVEHRGKHFKPRVNAGCRPLLDKWMAGGNPVYHGSPIPSAQPTLKEEKDDISLDKQEGQRLDSKDTALALQKRSATDAWVDDPYDTTRCKKHKSCTPELSSDTRISPADDIGCWSLSGSSVTSESSVEDDSEGGDEDDVKLGGRTSRGIKNADE